MSWWSARLFHWVQVAPFYEALHREAVALLPKANGQAWLDVGCGPGLVSRLAAARGYQVLGVDLSPAMVALAKRLAKPLDVPIRFEVGNVFDTPPLLAGEHRQNHAYDVVSAASLLAVLPDRAAALKALLSRVREGGTVLLIEPSEHMNRVAADQYIRAYPAIKGAAVLRLWARTRRPERAVVAYELGLPGIEAQCHPLLGGLVNAWIVRHASVRLERRQS